MGNDSIYEERKEKILGFIRDKQYKPMTPKDMVLLLGIKAEDVQMLYDIIYELEKKGQIIITKKNKVMLPESQNIYTGEFIGNQRGFGFVRCENSFEDIFIPASLTNGAMHKDIVMCRVIESTGRRPEAEIIKVIERGKSFVVGTYEKSRNFGFVIADDNRIDDIFISKSNNMGAVDGHKVVVKITKAAENGSNPEGKIVEILGHINDPGVDILSIIREYELPMDFSEEIYAYTNKIPDEVLPEELKDRKDYRNVQMVTIDGDDAKDLDDAVSVEVLENGNFKLGVYIADVSHYVKENSPLDKEAYKRGTSVYLVDRVIPMLPHKLSNGICSLNAGVDRLTLCCVMEIDNKGNVVTYDIEKAVINVDKRMSYSVVNDLLTNENSEYANEHKALMPMFENMKKLRDILFEKRIKRGAIEFESREAKIILDENGKPVDIKAYERNIATSIIEEFMLAANECIAECYFWLELPFVFRSHSEPDSEKIEKLQEYIGKIGYVLKGTSTHPKSFQKLLNQAKGKPEEMIVHRMVLRSLKQARYTATNDGHFGLATKYYCHFTSPIRRYPDLEIHRIISHNISGGLNGKILATLNKNIAEIAAHCSVRERVAEEAERETDKYKIVEYMSDRVGQVFDGIVSSVTSWGIYVELPNTVEGLVSVKTLNDDYYIFDESNLSFMGEHTHKTYKIGDAVRVKLVRANLMERNLDFEFID